MADRQGFYFQGEEKLKDWLRKVESKAGDHKALYDELGDILLDGVHDRFKRGVAPDGRPWQKSWRAIAQNGQTLRDTGRLLNSIITITKKNNVIVGTDVLYAKLMHYGGTIRAKSKPYLVFKTPTGGWVKRKSITVPARPIFGVSEDDAQNMLTAIEEYLEDLLRDAK